MWPQLIEWDTALFVWLNSLHAPWADGPMEWISGKTSWIPFYAVLLIAMFWHLRWRGFLALGFVALTIVLADQASVKLFKEVFQRLRPSHNPDLAQVIHLVNGYKGGSFGFVSSHAANTFALAAFMGLLFQHRGFMGFMLVWATIVSYSRIYLGVHYPGDILGGALLGWVIGASTYALYRWVLRNCCPEQQFSLDESQAEKSGDKQSHA